MSFGAGHLLPLLALAPVAGLAIGLLAWRRLRALEAWAPRALWPRLGFRATPRRRLAVAVLLSLAVGATCLALARPRAGAAAAPAAAPAEGPVVFVVDTSRSMGAADVHPDRLSVARAVVRRLLGHLEGRRAGLVQIEGQAHVLAPLTLDHEALLLALEGLQEGTLPVPGTRLAEGIEQALSLLATDAGGAGAVVLLSDGEDHDGTWKRRLTRIASRGVPVHALGVGTRTGARLLPRDGAAELGQQSAEAVVTRLDDELLRRLADATGGTFLELPRVGVELDPLARRLGGSDRSATVTEPARPREWAPRLLALAAAAVAAALAFGSPPPLRGEPR